MVWILPQQLYTYIVAGIKYVFKKYPAEIHSDATGQVCAEDYGCIFYEQDVPNTRRMLLAWYHRDDNKPITGNQTTTDLQTIFPLPRHWLVTQLNRTSCKEDFKPFTWYEQEKEEKHREYLRKKQALSIL